MSVKLSYLSGGTNSLQTTSEDFNKMLTWFKGVGVPYSGSIGAYTGDFAVHQGATPNKTIVVTAGKYICSCTPTGETLRKVMVELSADYTITLADNVTGATRYDKVYIYLPAASLANPPADGDFTEVATLKVQRDTTRGAEISDINYTLLAEVEVPASFTAITNPYIYDLRKFSELKHGWEPISETHTYDSATTITTPAGGLLKYSVGDKYKCNQAIPLTAYWPMEDKDDDMGAATVANIGTPTYTAGKFGNALTLNGTDQALAITDAAAFKPTGAWTMGFWIKTATADRTIFQSRSDNTNANGIRIFLGGAGTVCVGFGNNAATESTQLVSATAVTNNAFRYVVVSSQGNYTKIFLDGVLEYSGYSVTPTYVTNYVRIGCDTIDGTTNNRFFAGQIDDLFFINGHAVDSYWVAAQYALGTAQGSGDLTVSYKGYVVARTDTLLTVTGGADYALYNGTITNPYYSKASSPVGFPLGANWWIAPTLGSGWVNFGSGYAGAGYFRDSNGFVHLQGLIKSGTGAPNVIFNLPAGYRPLNDLLLVSVSNTSSDLLGTIKITSTGDVTETSGGNSYLSLNNISFLAQI